MNQSGGLDKIPLFVKDGGLIPMIPPSLHSPTKDEKLPLTVRYYGTLPGSFTLYDDDGQTFDYEKGTFGWTLLEVTDKIGRQLPTQGKPARYSIVRWEYMTP